VVVDWCDLPILSQQMYAKLETYKKEYTENVTIIDRKIYDMVEEKTTVLSSK
jgi:hypothetical protein